MSGAPAPTIALRQGFRCLLPDPELRRLPSLLRTRSRIPKLPLPRTRRSRSPSPTKSPNPWQPQRLWTGRRACESEVLKCKTEASKLSTQLKSLSYATQLVEDLEKYIVKFDGLYCDIRKLIQQKMDEERPYIVHVKSFVELQRSFQDVKASASAMARGVKAKASAKKGAKKNTSDGQQAA